MVAYAIARNMHRGFFKGLYFYFISALFVPFAIIMLPIAKETSLLYLDNRVGLVFLYVIFGLSLNIFIYVGYLRSIPKELEEAAVIDGASVWVTFWRVIFPLLTPINATVGDHHDRVGLERLHAALGDAVREGQLHVAAGPVRVPVTVHDGLQPGVRVLPDGSDAAADRLHRCAAVGHRRGHPRRGEVATACLPLVSRAGAPSPDPLVQGIDGKHDGS
jgi:Binding-protein-dependent transport system inner membrane component